MSEDSTETSPIRMSTRNQTRVNYNELVGGTAEKDNGVFRSPAVGTRGRKKRLAGDIPDFSANSSALGYNTPPKRGRPRGSAVVPSIRRAAPKRAGTEESEVEDKGLYGAVKSGKRLPEAIDQWIERYETNYPIATTELHQFFIAISGCKGVLTPQMSATMEFSDIIRRMTEDFDEDSNDYPLIQGGYFKKFKTNLHTFLHTFVEKCKSSLMFDNRLFDGVVQLLTGLADSQVRAFRHTATFVAMKISSALVDVVIELVSTKEKNAKQIEAEKAKNRPASDKLATLIAKKNEIEEKTEDVRHMLQYLFRSVFVHRYRDGVAEIRSLCITELGNWMLIYPEHFLEDSYLKYIGWSLYDKIGDVRLKCVRALMPLFEKSGMLDKLELFANKFKERLVSMVLDKDQETAIESCHLMRSMYIVFPTLLSVQDCVPIYELIYASNRQLAVAAGMFLNTKVFQTAEKPTKTANPNNVALLKDLITFFIEGECHEHATYLVDSLIDTNPIVKDWATMVDLLLNDQYKLSETIESKLIEVLTCSIQQTATGETPVGRVITKRGAPSTKETREQGDERVRLTEILIPNIASLILKYSTDREKIINLVQIPLHFQLDMYLAARMQNNLTELIKALETLVEKHVDEEVLHGVAEVHYYLSVHPTVGPQTEADRMKLIDGMALQLRKTTERVLQGSDADDEDEANFVSAIKRISAFSSFMDLKKWDLWDLLLKISSNYDRDDTRRDVQEKAILMLFTQLNFDLLNLTKDGESIKADAIKKLKKKRDVLVRCLVSLLENGASGVEQAYLSLCDLLIMFGPQLAVAYPKTNIDQLVLKPDGQMGNELKLFLEHNAFGAETQNLDQQEHIEMMHKKRKLVAQYAKLILHGSLEVKNLQNVMRKYVSNFSDFGDIFKNLLLKCREVNFVETGTTLMQTLETEFEQKLEIDRSLDPLSDSFSQLRDLAKRFVPAFGSDFKLNRYAVASAHKEAIEFAFKEFDRGVTTNDREPPENLLFLEIAIEFSSKLLVQDKQALLKYLNKIYPAAAPGKGQWEPYKLYVASLTEKDDDAMSVRSFSTVRSDSTYRSSTPRGRGRGRGSRRNNDF